MKRKDILIGSATVPCHESGGWALPGGGVTTDFFVAAEVAAGLAEQIDKVRADNASRREEALKRRPSVTYTKRQATDERLPVSRC